MALLRRWNRQYSLPRNMVASFGHWLALAVLVMPTMVRADCENWQDQYVLSAENNDKVEGCRRLLSPDGNFSVEASGNRISLRYRGQKLSEPAWLGRDAHSLVMQRDGNFVQYRDFYGHDVAYFASNTVSLEGRHHRAVLTNNGVILVLDGAGSVLYHSLSCRENASYYLEDSNWFTCGCPEANSVTSLAIGEVLDRCTSLVAADQQTLLSTGLSVEGGWSLRSAKHDAPWFVGRGEGFTLGNDGTLSLMAPQSDRVIWQTNVIWGTTDTGAPYQARLTRTGDIGVYDSQGNLVQTSHQCPELKPFLLWDTAAQDVRCAICPQLEDITALVSGKTVGKCATLFSRSGEQSLSWNPATRKWEISGRQVPWLADKADGLELSVDGVLALLSSDFGHGQVWTSDNWHQGVGPYQAVLSNAGDMVVLDSNQLVVFTDKEPCERGDMVFEPFSGALSCFCPQTVADPAQDLAMLAADSSCMTPPDSEQKRFLFSGAGSSRLLSIPKSRSDMVSAKPKPEKYADHHLVTFQRVPQQVSKSSLPLYQIATSDGTVCMQQPVFSFMSGRWLLRTDACSLADPQTFYEITAAPDGRLGLRHHRSHRCIASQDSEPDPEGGYALLGPVGAAACPTDWQLQPFAFYRPHSLWPSSYVAPGSYTFFNEGKGDHLAWGDDLAVGESLVSVSGEYALTVKEYADSGIQMVFKRANGERSVLFKKSDMDQLTFNDEALFGPYSLFANMGKPLIDRLMADIDKESLVLWLNNLGQVFVTGKLPGLAEPQILWTHQRGSISYLKLQNQTGSAVRITDRQTGKSSYLGSTFHDYHSDGIVFTNGGRYKIEWNDTCYDWQPQYSTYGKIVVDLPFTLGCFWGNCLDVEGDSKSPSARYGAKCE